MRKKTKYLCSYQLAFITSSEMSTFVGFRNIEFKNSKSLTYELWKTQTKQHLTVRNETVLK